MRSAEILAHLAHLGIRLDLAPMRRLLADDAFDVPAVLVAGTNGKGSTASFLESMGRAAGYGTGLFTSPCLERPSEQILIDGEDLADLAVAAVLDKAVRDGERLGLGLTAFEALTAAALRIFAIADIDLAVLEAGMGGARDATNVVEPLVSVVTTVGLDHQGFLGEDVASIARDKAGVFRQGAPAIWGWIEESDAEEELERAASVIDALAIPARRRVRGLERHEDGGVQHVAFVTPRRCYRLETALAGAHQARNLALAVLAAEELAERGFPRLDEDAIVQGAKACRLPGRLEWIAGAPRPILLDAAHNASGTAALAAYLDERGGPFDLLFGALGDKDARAMLDVLARRARRVVLTAPRDPRAWDPGRFAAAVDAAVEADLDAALRSVLVADDVPLVVTGSVRLVGQARGRILC